jgi:hypothetical protein
MACLAGDLSVCLSIYLSIIAYEIYMIAYSLLQIVHNLQNTV